MKNIMLFCAAGMSTSLLVNRMKEAAAAEGYECTIAAYPLSEVTSKGKDADVILLGPQVRYNLKKVQEDFTDKPVEAIDMRMYGMMDGKGVLGQAKKLMGE
jgi:PTS system cellobiose-specific IIB component